MLNIVEHFPKIEDKSSLIFRMLYDLDSWDDYTLEIFERYEDETKNSHENSIYTYTDFLKKISKSNIDYSIDKLFDYLNETLDVRTEIDVDKKDLIDRKSLDLVKKLIEKEPLKIIKKALPYIEKIVLRSVHKENEDTYLLYNRTFSYMDLDSRIYKIYSLYKHVLNQLKILAKENKPIFLELVKPYKDTRHEALLGLFILGCEDEKFEYLEEIYRILNNRRLIEEISFSENIGYSLLQILADTFDYFSREQQIVLIEVFNRVSPDRSRYSDIETLKFKRIYRGYRRYQILLKISVDKLKEFSVYKDFQELSRKFDWYKEEKPHKMKARWIGSPLSEDAYKFMTFNSWKQSMKVYGLNRRDRKEKDFLKGGKLEHSRAFEDVVKENPTKYYTFLLELKDDIEIEEDYLCSGLNALVEVKYDNEKIAKAILKFSDCQDNYFKKSIIRAIHNLSYQDYFDKKFIDILINYKDVEYEGIGRNKEYESIHDNITSAINSVQGVLAETLADIFKFIVNIHLEKLKKLKFTSSQKLLTLQEPEYHRIKFCKKSNENRDKVIQLIEEMIDSKYEYVVFGLLRRLGRIAKVDEELYRIFIFKILDRDEVGKITLYLMDVLHIFVNKKIIDFKIFENYVEKSLKFIENNKDEEDTSQQELGQILFYHYLTNQDEEYKNLLDKSISVSSKILAGVISQAFHEIKSDDINRVELAKEYIVRYKNNEGVSWNFHFSMKNLHDGCFIENDLKFIKEIASSVETRRESTDFWDYLKNEFDAKKYRAEKILEVVEAFIDSYQKESEEYRYKNEEKIEFIMELYSRFKTDESKEKVLDILEKFLKNDAFRNVVQRQLDN